MSRGSLGLGVGALVVGLTLLGGGRELHRGVTQWEQLSPLPPGESAPTFDVITLEGGRFDQRGLVGQVSVVTFWATWCGACVDELGDLDRIQRDYAGRDVQFLAINNDGGGLSPRQAARRVRHFVATRRLGLPCALDDGTAARRFRVGSIPHTLLVDRRGVVRHVHQGRVMSSTLQQELDELLAEG